MTTTLGIIAGGGELPVRLVEYCEKHHRPYFILSFEGNPTLLTPHATVRFGAIGEALKTLRDAGVGELVMAGPMRRPPLLGRGGLPAGRRINRGLQAGQARRPRLAVLAAGGGPQPSRAGRWRAGGQSGRPPAR